MTDTAHRGGLAPALVGRERELVRVDAVLDRLGAGSPQILVVTGEPGIGKTRLLAEVARRADGRGWQVLEGRGGEFERALPFGVFVGACDEYLGSLDARSIERLVGDELGELTTIFPALHAFAPGDRRPSLVDERFRAHRAVAELLGALAVRGPVVLVLDDLHWCDDASAELLGHLVRRPPDGPVALALSFRTGRAPGRLADALGGAGHEPLELPVLTGDEAAALLVGFDPATKSALYEESGGNPFYLEQLARAGASGARAGGRIQLDGGLDVSPTVASAIARELAGLSPQARTVIEAAAVAGDPFEPDVAAEVAQVTEAGALVAIDAALMHGLLRSTTVPRRFAFRHPIVRRVVYENATAGWRLGAHARAAAVLESRGAAAAERAHHVEQSARRGDERAIGVLSEAAAHLAPRAPTLAARWLAAVLRLLPADAESRAEVLAALAQALAASGRLEESRSALIELLELLPADAIAARVPVTAACASIEHLLGHHERAHERLSDALARLPDDRSPEAVALMVELGVDAFYVCCAEQCHSPVGDFGSMREWAARAHRAAAEPADPALRVAATALLGWASAMVGDADATVRHCNDAAAQTFELSDDELAARIDGLVYLAWTEYLIGRYHESLATFERGIAISRASSQGQFLLQLREGQANNLAVLGRVSEALEASEAAVESARLSDTRQALAWSLGGVCLWATYAGDLDRARRAGEEAVELAHGLDFSVLAMIVAFDLAACLVEAGEPDRAIELALRAGGPGLRREPDAWLALHCDILVRAYVDAGRQRDAELAAASAGEVADRVGWVVARMQADRARAAALFGAGDWSPAAAAALESAAGADGLGARLDEGRARLLAGRALAAAGETDRAKQELRRSERTLHECGALRWRGQAVRELRKLGVRVAPQARGGRAGDGGVASLTAREREIAGLVWDRRTNAEIAAELFLSRKTIETHLRNVFYKLGASSRVEVARAIDRERDTR
jgi:ATP/maltotriose-dependent transcriptional regulator MalT